MSVELAPMLSILVAGFPDLRSCSQHGKLKEARPEEEDCLRNTSNCS